jgi:hypothetical protein
MHCPKNEGFGGCWFRDARSATQIWLDRRVSETAQLHAYRRIVPLLVGSRWMLAETGPRSNRAPGRLSQQTSRGPSHHPPFTLIPTPPQARARAPPRVGDRHDGRADAVSRRRRPVSVVGDGASWSLTNALISLPDVRGVEFPCPIHAEKVPASSERLCLCSAADCVH